MYLKSSFLWRRGDSYTNNLQVYLFYLMCDAVQFDCENKLLAWVRVSWSAKMKHAIHTVMDLKQLIRGVTEYFLISSGDQSQLVKYKIKLHSILIAFLYVHIYSENTSLSRYEGVEPGKQLVQKKKKRIAFIRCFESFVLFST